MKKTLLIATSALVGAAFAASMASAAGKVVVMS